MGILLGGKTRDSNIEVFRDLYENAPVSYQSLDSKGKIVKVNQTWLDTLGYSKKDVMGKEFKQFLTEDSKKRFKKRFEYFLKKKEIKACELQLVTKDKRIILASFEGKIFKEPNQDPKTHCIFIDITDRREVEKNLDESRKRYSKLIEYSPFGIAIHKMIFNSKNKPSDYIFLEVNPSFERLTGLSKDDVIGKKVSEVIPDIGKTKFIQIYGDIVQKGKPKVFEEYSQPLKKYYEITAYALGDSQFVTLFQDITESKKIHDKLKEKMEETDLFNKITLERELKMVELKKEIEKLKVEKGK